MRGQGDTAWSIQTAHIRNIVFAGHEQTDKTTLFERLLHAAGVIIELRIVESGKTVSDSSPEEIQRRISTLCVAGIPSVAWHHLSPRVERPSAADFTGKAISAFCSSEMALMLVDSHAEVQIQTIKLWRYLNRRNKSRAAFVNRLEAFNSDFKAASKDIRAKFGTEAASVVVPNRQGDSYKGVIDVLYGAACFASPDDTAKKAAFPPSISARTAKRGVCLPGLRRKATMICS